MAIPSFWSEFTAQNLYFSMTYGYIKVSGSGTGLNTAPPSSWQCTRKMGSSAKSERQNRLKHTSAFMLTAACACSSCTTLGSVRSYRWGLNTGVCVISVLHPHRHNVSMWAENNILESSRRHCLGDVNNMV